MYGHPSACPSNYLSAAERQSEEAQEVTHQSKEVVATVLPVTQSGRSVRDQQRDQWLYLLPKLRRVDQVVAERVGEVRHGIVRPSALVEHAQDVTEVLAQLVQRIATLLGTVGQPGEMEKQGAQLV